MSNSKMNPEISSGVPCVKYFHIKMEFIGKFDILMDSD